MKIAWVFIKHKLLISQEWKSSIDFFIFVQTTLFMVSMPWESATNSAFPRTI